MVRLLINLVFITESGELNISQVDGGHNKLKSVRFTMPSERQRTRRIYYKNIYAKVK